MSTQSTSQSPSSTTTSPPLHVEELSFASTSVREGDVAASDIQQDTTVVLHGLLGNGRNLRSFVNTLFTRIVGEEERRGAPPSQHKVLLMDLRHHGHTNAKYHPQNADTLENTAKDVFDTLAVHDPSSTSSNKPLRIIGHSLGGKVALAAAQLSRDPCQVWTLDSFPFSFDETHSRNALGVLKILETIEGIVQPLESRQELYEILDSFGFQKNLQEWLGSNLVGNPDEGYVWNFHLPGAFNLYRDYSRTDFTDLLHEKNDHSFGIVRALLSRGWDEESIRRLESLGKVSQERGHNTHVYELDNAGHWLHAQNPQGLVNLMIDSDKFIH
jgi:pimeloyl-ACP methyl ester carboxylesterase